MKFFLTLFDANETVKLANNYYDQRQYTIFQAMTMAGGLAPSETGTIVSLNGTANGLISLRNLLFEIDETGVSPEEQLKFFIDAGLPISMATFTGGKSLHAIISLENPLPDLHTYKQWHYAIRRAMKFRPDKNTDKPGITTKVPGGKRERNDEVHNQKPYFTGSRVPNQLLQNWMTLKGVYRYACQPPKVYPAPDLRTVNPKLVGYVQANNPKRTTAGFLYSACPSCGGSKFWFGEKSGNFGCWHGCSKVDILKNIPESYGEGIEIDEMIFTYDEDSPRKPNPVDEEFIRLGFVPEDEEEGISDPESLLVPTVMTEFLYKHEHRYPRRCLWHLNRAVYKMTEYDKGTVCSLQDYWSSRLCLTPDQEQLLLSLSARYLVHFPVWEAVFAVTRYG